MEQRLLCFEIRTLCLDDVVIYHRLGDAWAPEPQYRSAAGHFAGQGSGSVSVEADHLVMSLSRLL